MQKLADTIKLMAKTGLYFASVDGAYSESEKQYISNFLAGIEQIGALDNNLKAEVEDASQHTYNLEDIIKETRTLLEGFTADEQVAIKDSLKAFIGDIVKADGTCCTAEQESFRTWQEALA